MPLDRKTLFLKSWLWSLIGAGVLEGLFWILTDFIHILQRLNSLTDFTNIVLIISVVGNILGAGLVAWRVADKHYHAQLRQSMRRYWLMSFISLAVAALLIFVISLLTPIIAIWNLLAPLCVVQAIKANQDRRL